MIAHSLAVSFLFSPLYTILAKRVTPPPPKKRFSISPQAINRDRSLRKHHADATESIISIVQVPVEYFSLSSLVAKARIPAMLQNETNSNARFRFQHSMALKLRLIAK